MHNDVNVNTDYSDDFDKIDLVEILNILISNKLKIIFLTLLITIPSVIYIFSIPNTYLSYSVLAPASSLNNSSGITSRYSGVASLAGISIPSGSNSEKVTRAIEVMKSLEFFENFVDKYNLDIKILAVKGWNRQDNSLLYDKKIYDYKNKKWVSDIKFAINGKPSSQYAHEIFLKNLSIEVDRKTKFVTLTYEHFSPNIAKEILDSILEEINNIIKEDEVKLAELSIQFLKQELENTKVQDIQESLNQLVQSNYETIVLANSSPEYLFKTLSPSFAPEKKHSPSRLILTVGVLIFSFFISVITILVNFYFKNKK